MLCLPQPFANCYILLFSLSGTEKSELLWRGGMEAVWVARASTSLPGFYPVSPFIYLSISESVCASICLLHGLTSLSGRGENLQAAVNKSEQSLLSFSWSSNNEPIVCILIDTRMHSDRHWGVLSSAGWYGQICSWSRAWRRLVQGWTENEDGLGMKKEVERCEWLWKKKLQKSRARGADDVAESFRN